MAVLFLNRTNKQKTLIALNTGLSPLQKQISSKELFILQSDGRRDRVREKAISSWLPSTPGRKQGTWCLGGQAPTCQSHLLLSKAGNGGHALPESQATTLALHPEVLLLKKWKRSMLKPSEETQWRHRADTLWPPVEQATTRQGLEGWAAGDAPSGNSRPPQAQTHCQHAGELRAGAWRDCLPRLPSS